MKIALYADIMRQIWSCYIEGEAEFDFANIPDETQPLLKEFIKDLDQYIEASGDQAIVKGTCC